MDYNEFMNSTVYFYFGLFNEWVRENSVRGGFESDHQTGTAKNPPLQAKGQKVQYFDQLPNGFW